jgi:glycosyltransferase involved in cell wall biosynthesis
MPNRIIICSSPNTKSIPLYFYLLANHLRELGNEVILIIDQGGKMNLMDFPPHNSLKIVTWPNPRPIKFRDYLFFLNLCKSFKPNLVISQFSSNTNVLLVSRFFPKTKFFVYWHSMQEQLTTDLKTSKFIYNLLVLRKRLVFRISKFRFLTNSKDLKEELAILFPFYKKEILVLNYLMPDPTSFTQIKPYSDREYCISFVSRLDKSKGHESFIHTFSAILPYFPGLKLKIVGSGSELARLKQLVADLSITENVVFMGECDYQTVLDTMSNSLIHVSNSKQEAFGMVNVEAISLGTPILANRVGGIKEILQPGINGEYIDVSNLDDFRQKVEKILAQENWKEYSKLSREVFLNRFSANSENFQQQIHLLLKSS